MASIGSTAKSENEKLPKRRKLARHLRNFFDTEASGGIIMIACAVLAIFLANGDSPEQYFSLIETQASVGVAEFNFSRSISWWIENVAMSFFFFLIGLELKREIMEGALSDKSQLALPLFSAIAGIAAPAAIYLFINRHDPSAFIGWAVPTATDVAFAICILMMVTRVPPALKVFLLALAILDDIAAVIIIALFYSNDLSLIWLLTGFSISLLLFFMNSAGVHHAGLFFVVGAILWLCLYNGGIHPCLAGSLVACFVPMDVAGSSEVSPLKKMVSSIHGWTAYLILPLFAFTAAGVNFSNITAHDLLNPAPLGIIAGLFLGKQIGVFSAFYLTVKSGLVKMPDNVTWPQVYGVAVLTGIGFTMSLFVNELAFGYNEETSGAAKLAVVIGSLMSALLGYVVLVFSCRYLSAQPMQEIASEK